MSNKFQAKVKNFMDRNKLNSPVENRMLDFFDEVGEVAKEINKMSAYGTKKPNFRKEIITELGDAFYSLITIANYYEIDLEKSLDMVLEKYKKRINQGGTAGSEND